MDECIHVYHSKPQLYYINILISRDSAVKFCLSDVQLVTMFTHN